MFIGEYTYSIDEKKRLGIPAKFRDTLGKKAVITRGFDSCLSLYTMKEWEIYAEKLGSLPTAQADARGIARLMLSGAMEVSFDALGRILIPDYLKEYAGLGKKITVAGLFKKIEIWDEAKWKQYQETTTQEAGNIAERLKELGI